MITNEEKDVRNNTAVKNFYAELQEKEQAEALRNFIKGVVFSMAYRSKEDDKYYFTGDFIKGYGWPAPLQYIYEFFYSKYSDVSDNKKRNDKALEEGGQMAGRLVKSMISESKKFTFEIMREQNKQFSDAPKYKCTKIDTENIYDF